MIRFQAQIVAGENGFLLACYGVGFLARLIAILATGFDGFRRDKGFDFAHDLIIAQF